MLAAPAWMCLFRGFSENKQELISQVDEILPIFALYGERGGRSTYELFSEKLGHTGNSIK